MGQVTVGLKCLPKTSGPENFANIPKYLELEPGLIYKLVFARYDIGTRYFPDIKGQHAAIIADYRALFRKILIT